MESIIRFLEDKARQDLDSAETLSDIEFYKGCLDCLNEAWLYGLVPNPISTKGKSVPTTYALGWNKKCEQLSEYYRYKNV